MHTDRDTTRIVQSWLDEGVTALPDRVLDAVLDQVPATRQRRSWWPAWRFADMNSLAKFAIAAAAVVVVALVGINLLPSSGGVGVQPPSASPSASPSPSPSATPEPSPADFPPAGAMAAGRHSMILNGRRFMFTVPSGWVSNGTFGVDKAAGPGPDGAAFIFWKDVPIGVFSDPCGNVKAPPAGPSSADLAAAVASVPGLEVISGPTDVTVGGFPAKHVVVAVPENIGCPPNEFYLWYAAPADQARYATSVGDTIRVWIVDVEGSIVWIDGETYKGAGPGPGQEIQQIIDSIQFE